MTEGYCMKCRKKVEIKDAKKITMKNGKPAIQGACPKCGTKVFRIGG
jgi:DNA-directed RNA polymerase subunit RPC12/RpoP